MKGPIREPRSGRGIRRAVTPLYLYGGRRGSRQTRIGSWVRSIRRVAAPFLLEALTLLFGAAVLLLLWVIA